MELREIDPRQLAQQLADTTASVRLVDVRTPAEFLRGAIAGAKNIPLHLLPLRVDELQGSAPIVFCCRSGARSAQACLYMMAQGHASAVNLRGGVVSWVYEGMPLVEPQAESAAPTL